MSRNSKLHPFGCIVTFYSNSTDLHIIYKKIILAQSNLISILRKAENFDEGNRLAQSGISFIAIEHIQYLI